MPSDLRSSPSSSSHSGPAPPTSKPTQAPARVHPLPPRRSARPSPLRVFLICFLGALYALAAIRFSLPPHSWVERWVRARDLSKGDKVLLSRPGLRGVERYSPQYKYRPAIMPVVTEVGKDGKVRRKGEYY
ncbi:uncharacterized protein JCM10292_005280 [Rhodotorula paludigena]|uniref:uncharacterized protein n=1 Tax=Rhodotorula paludigena TaxID=86838 RepID=UPI00317F2E3C